MIDRDFEKLMSDPAVAALETMFYSALDKLKERKKEAEGIQQQLATVTARYERLRRVAISLVSFQAGALVALVVYAYWRAI